MWNFALVAVPLSVGLATDAVVGWWSGLSALLIAAVLIGTAAYRASLRHRDRRDS
jgi:hypothetical protein